MRRGLLCLNLEVHESIVWSMTRYLDAMIVEHDAAPARAGGMEEAARSPTSRRGRSVARAVRQVRRSPHGMPARSSRLTSVL
jgi:hypothetical protein